MVIPKQKSSSQSNVGFFNNNFNKPKRPEAENKNSILNKFRIELNKSQSIISKELFRSKELKLKFLKKRKKQKAEEEAKQLLIKNSPQNLNLINIQNNIINNSNGFKHKTSMNFNDSPNRKNNSPTRLNISQAENSINKTISVKRTTNNNTKEDFFATEVKDSLKNTLKNPLSPMKEKKIDRNFNTNNPNNVYSNNSNPATSRNSNIILYNEKKSELNQMTPKEYSSLNSYKK